MAEAIATVGLVAAIIEISSFAKKLADRCTEYRSRSYEVPQAFRSISIQLPLVVSSLGHTRAQAESGSLSEESLTVLQPVIEACHEETKDLGVILNKVLPPVSASSWDRKALAYRSLRYEAEVKKSMVNLDSHIQKLAFFFQASMSFQTSTSAARLLQLELSSVREHGQIVNLQNQLGRLMAKPSLLKESLDNFEAIQLLHNEDIAKNTRQRDDLTLSNRSSDQEHWQARLVQRPTLEAHNSLDLQPSGRLCTCKRPRIQQSWTKNFLGATFGSQSIYTHRRGCPFYREKEGITKLSFDISLMSQLVNTAARLSLSLQYGAGGMSLSPNLTLRGVKRLNSRIFALLETLKGVSAYDTSAWTLRMEEILPQITLLVQSGQASPHDVDEYGRTVFQVLHTDPFSILLLNPL
ncbi:MAG: hypothetical protein Q9201_006043 [Fulgogasparrea decipioides]